MASGRHLEVYGKDEGVLGEAEGVGFVEGGRYAVVGTGEDVVEAGLGTEPVNTGWAEEVVGRGGLLCGGEVGTATEVEEVAWRGCPAVGALFEVDAGERSAGGALLNPVVSRGHGGSGFLVFWW